MILPTIRKICLQNQRYRRCGKRPQQNKHRKEQKHLGTHHRPPSPLPLMLDNPRICERSHIRPLKKTQHVKKEITFHRKDMGKCYIQRRRQRQTSTTSNREKRYQTTNRREPTEPNKLTIIKLKVRGFYPNKANTLPNAKKMKKGTRVDPLTSILAVLARSCQILSTSWQPWIPWQDSY